MTKIKTKKDLEEEGLMNKYFSFLKCMFEESFKVNEKQVYLKREIYSSLRFIRISGHDDKKRTELYNSSISALHSLNFKEILLNDVNNNIFIHKFRQSLEVKEQVSLIAYIIKNYPKSKYSETNFHVLLSNANLIDYQEINTLLENKIILKNLMGEPNQMIANLDVIQHIIEKTPEIKRSKIFDVLENYFPEILMDEVANLENKYLTNIQKILRKKKNNGNVKEKNKEFNLSIVDELIKNTKETTIVRFDIGSESLLKMGFQKLSLLDMYGIKINIGRMKFITELNSAKNEINLEINLNETSLNIDDTDIMERANFKKNIEFYKEFFLKMIVETLKEINLNLVTIKKEKKSFGDILQKYLNENTLIEYVAKIRENDLTTEIDKIQKEPEALRSRKKI